MRLNHLSANPVCEVCKKRPSMVIVWKKDDNGKSTEPHVAACHKCVANEFRTNGSSASSKMTDARRAVNTSMREYRKSVPQICNKCGKHGGSLEVDHIVPRSVRPDLAADKSNFQMLCRSCHAKKTQDDIIVYAHWYAKERGLKVLPYSVYSGE